MRNINQEFKRESEAVIDKTSGEEYAFDRAVGQREGHIAVTDGAVAEIDSECGRRDGLLGFKDDQRYEVVAALLESGHEATRDGCDQPLEFGLRYARLSP
jgi:hypothetical protein